MRRRRRRRKWEEKKEKARRRQEMRRQRRRRRRRRRRKQNERYVGKDVREKYELLLQDSELVTDPWKYILPAPRKSTLPAAILDQPGAEQPSPKSSSITKFTKKMTEEERKKQLITKNAESSSIKRDDATIVTKESSSVKTFDETLVSKESSSVKNDVATPMSKESSVKKDDPTPMKRESSVKKDVVSPVAKGSSSVKKDEIPSVSKNSNAQDCSSTPEPMNISKSPEDFLGFQVDNSTPGSTSAAGSLKTAHSESRVSRSIASFFTKGTNKSSAKKLFDGKQVESAKSGASESTSVAVAAPMSPAAAQDSKMDGESETCPKPLKNVEEPEGLIGHQKSSEPGKINVGVGLSSHQSPAKKRVKLTTLSPPKWRVKLAKPPPPSSSSNDNDDEVIVLE
ncbi:hypothetical protein LSTR_LSTR009277 [Laodelphax striatellus]|uniref:Uncharacterized protein n=1 Tax=Laodelphax striatellus TaxID=195883 RepID=A0A482X529_LAOST|nr:hypothetical protein LSTR_LSTR009277 [Laodelphax striatellus]